MEPDKDYYVCTTTVTIGDEPGTALVFLIMPPGHKPHSSYKVLRGPFFTSGGGARAYDKALDTEKYDIAIEVSVNTIFDEE